MTQVTSSQACLRLYTGNPTRAIAGASWFQFETFQTYKSEFLGGSVVKIDPRHTSVTCARCGSRDKGNRENQAKFLCLSCGHSDHADVNAAVNIHKSLSHNSIC